ncbi:uncharacterized protein CG43867 [Eurytemora carolleeae]|uniref:uncharacterized protein CG43867 n=1 Tax=Eurytemora carolleeae TaxID=1294199 RepID=UPI000C779702|nr:uncharacterized protein CG43867 [Eurytemora carolleeae]|eukprot:XP_023332150.1 uncharacterized protein CG43867-like [Eurytemora affinis]
MSELKSPKSPLEALDDALDLVMPSARFSIPIPPPRNKQKSGDTHSSSTCQAGPVMSEEYSDYSEIFTPTDPRDRWDEHMVSAMSGNESMSACSSVRSVSVRSAPSCSVPAPAPVPSPPSAPAPPLHKVPSWENRIYEAATSQIILGAEMDCSNNNIDQPVLATFQDTLSVPVFAAIKGRASRVQSWPVNGDASDSSDGEEGRQGDEEEEGRQGDGEKEKVGEGRENEGRNRESRLNSRHIRDISIDSDLSGDYAFPPDELTLPTRSSFLESSRVGERSYEKCGYLTKLGGKFKSWQKRYFQLKDGNLAYWKSHHDMDRKPQGVILLTETCRVQRAEGSTTFQVTLQDRIHYLTADSLVVAEEWVSQLQNVVQMNALRIVLSKENTTPTLQGWLIKVKHGHSRRCWCVLLGKMFVYFKTPTDQNPLGQINMRDSRVEEVEHISDSDSETGDGLEESHPTLGIFPNHVHQGPTYLIFPNKSEEEKWLYQLTVVSGGDPKAGTQFEQLIQKLMESEGDTGNVLWKHPVMVYNKDPLSSPLTTLPTDILQAEAVKLFKSVNLFCSVVLDSSGIDYHVVLVQNTIQQCLQTPQLQAELFAILAKQTSRHAANRHGVQSFLLNATSIFSCDSSGGVSSPPDTSPTSSQLSKSNPPDTTFIQAWMLMAVAVSIFVPRNNRLLWFLRTHLARNKDSKSETGKYAAYCSKALERCVNNGSRVAKPSRLEVLSILLKNPHHHSLPHAVPVHLLNGTYQVVGFDGSTTIEEFEATLTDLINCRPANQSGFSIFSDDPLDPTLHHSLAKQEKVCDVLSGWETALRERGSGKFQNKRAIKFTFKNRLYWKKGVLNETEKEKLLYCYQVSEQIVSGKFPVNQELAFELAALMAQIEFGDVDKQHVGEVLNRFYPARYNTDKQQHQTLINRWSQLSGKTGSDCVRILLTCTRKWQFFGANLFQVQEVPEGNLQWLAVTDDGIAVLDPGSLQVVSRYPYSTVVSFGGCGDNFMLVVLVSSTLNNTNKTNKLIFSTTKVKILELTVVIADYMNALGQIIPISRPKSRSVSQSRPSAPSTPKLQRDRCLERNSSSVDTIKGKRSKSAGRREYKS